MQTRGKKVAYAQLGPIYHELRPSVERWGRQARRSARPGSESCLDSLEKDSRQMVRLGPQTQTFGRQGTERHTEEGWAKMCAASQPHPRGPSPGTSGWLSLSSAQMDPKASVPAVACCCTEAATAILCQGKEMGLGRLVWVGPVGLLTSEF